MKVKICEISVSETDRPKPLWLAGRVQTFQNSIKFCGVKHRDRLARAIEGTMTLLQDNEKIYPEWRRLVMRNSVRGVQVHDAHLAAAMRVHDVSHILTFNQPHFARYTSIKVVHPRDIRARRR